MDAKKFGLSILMIAGIIFCGKLQAKELQPMFTPYIGVDAQYRQLGYKGPLNETRFRKNAGQPHIYGGIKINNYFGIEAGATMFRSKHEELNHKARLATMHLGVICFAPLPSDGHSLLGSIGITSGKTRFDMHSLSQAVTFKSHKKFLRLMVGSQHMISENLGVRLGLIHEATSRLVMKEKHPTLQNKSIDIKPRNSVTYSIGLIYQF